MLKLSRSGLYYRPRLVSPADLAIMRRIDELHLDYPFAGSRMLRDLLRAEGIGIGRQHVATLMRRMGIAAIYRRPNTFKPAPGHKIYPYLLRCVDRRPTRCGRWTSPTSRWRGLRLSGRRGGLVSRRVLAWRLSITLEVEFCLEAVEEALPARQTGDLQHRPGQSVYQHRLHRPAAEDAIAISIDGKGSWRDNVFVERLWRSVEYGGCISGPMTASPRRARRSPGRGVRAGGNCCRHQATRFALTPDWTPATGHWLLEGP